MRLRAPGALPPAPLALAEHVHPGLLDELRANPDDRWTPEWRDLLRAATPENVAQLGIEPVAEYLAETAPDRWPF